MQELCLNKKWDKTSIFVQSHFFWPFLAINSLMVINHIFYYKDAKAETKRLWVTDVFLTGLLCPFSNIFSPLENGGFAYT